MKESSLSTLFSVDFNGMCEMLAGLKQQRLLFSLSGLNSTLLAVGGLNEVFLNTCELYSVRSNKWGELPPLHTPRKMPGSILLKSMKAFCFLGNASGSKLSFTSSIERLQIGCESSWSVLPITKKTNNSFNLVAAPF